jgi:hypothetical protein
MIHHMGSFQRLKSDSHNIHKCSERTGKKVKGHENILPTEIKKTTTIITVSYLHK